MDQQQADHRDIRARAEQVFTTAFVLGAAIAASYSSGGGHGTPGKLIYLAAAALTGLARLAAGGIITARSAIGAPYLANIRASPPGELE